MRRELAGEIEAFAREPDGGLMVLPEVSTANNRDLIIALAARHRLPAVYPLPVLRRAAAGCSPMAVDVADVFRRAASYVDRILKGAKPADLPVQAPTQVRARRSTSRPPRRSASTVPPTLLARADEVIE